jgi:uncharacterized membrane protein
VRRREDLTTPRTPRRGFGVHYDPDDFGRFSEAIARFIGTARFLVWQSIFILVWVVWNFLLPHTWRFDDPTQGLVRLTLILSLQAAYAAPLILLAQNRQESRDRTQSETDRRMSSRTQADTEFLARELASVRLNLGDSVNQSDVSELTKAIERLSAEVRAALDDRADTVPERVSLERHTHDGPPSAAAS